MWLQPRCGYPYEHEPEKRADLQDFARGLGVSFGAAKTLKGLNPRLLRDAGYGVKTGRVDDQGPAWTRRILARWLRRSPGE